MIIPRDQHSISRRNISENALKVLYRLNRAGYQAYLVGGSVRDLLLDNRPKDFDIATSAHPEQVSALFRNCRLIGRRFRLAHVHFHGEIVEVATFRAKAQVSNKPSKHKDKMIIRDNVFGVIEEDVWRRDFTINALYYNIADFSVVDYMNGMQDLVNRQIRIIGDPEQRYEEDPVRMLRAIRFANKLNFSIEAETEKPITRLGPLLELIPPARLFEEFLKLFLNGDSEKNFHSLYHYGLLYYLFPITAQHIKQDPAFLRLINLTLQNTDQRIADGKPVTPIFLLAVFLWSPIKANVQTFLDEGELPMRAFMLAMDVTIKQQTQRLTIPRRFSMVVKEIWRLQNRLERRPKFTIFKTLHHPRFRAAYDFLVLRAAAGEDLQMQVDWWTKIQTADPDTQESMVKLLANKRKPQRKSVA